MWDGKQQEKGSNNTLTTLLQNYYIKRSMATQIQAAMLKSLVICLWSTCSYNITGQKRQHI